MLLSIQYPVPGFELTVSQFFLTKTKCFHSYKFCSQTSFIGRLHTRAIICCLLTVCLDF